MTEGFVWEANDARWQDARPSARVEPPQRTPPSIVVHHALSNVLVTPWPGRLWRVRIVEPRDDAERDAFEDANRGLLQPARHTRAFAVDVIEELPVVRTGKRSSISFTRRRPLTSRRRTPCKARCLRRP
ncbi:hypothetical protein [Deinococcus yavapaiensis]|uniref:hypothetical protein n=1 Tax=Deinococcus yavapaiensis TaxID=309889 RepID=UPI000DA1E3D6|nr:hypothetical protein [Deinococcus yavapaiensis]